MRTETVLRKTLHHPLVYSIVAIVVTLVGLLDNGNLGYAVGQGIGTWIVVWFVTGLIP